MDIITFGSPCQDMSVAGKRGGLSGERSSLYFQAVRIIKEMLNATNREYPKFLMFENVPGMLSSNGGADFIKALDIVQDLGFIPDPQILDAQDMGVPQRRKRVYITWVQADYILRKKTVLSYSLTLQLLTELLLINLAELSRAYGAELPKSVQEDASRTANGLIKRMNLFSLQKDGHLQKLQKRLDEIKAMLQREAENLDLYRGADRTAEISLTLMDMKFGDIDTENLYGFTGRLLSECWADSCEIMKSSITSIWTREIIARKICLYFQALLSTLDATICCVGYAQEKKSPVVEAMIKWIKLIPQARERSR